MSKKLRVQRVFVHPTAFRQPSYRFWGGVVALIVVISGAVLLFRNNGSDFIPQVIGAPRLAVAQDTFDYGDVKNGTTIETVFELQNVGDKNLSILEIPQVEVVRGCCPPKAEIDSTLLIPGEQTKIKLRFMMHDGMDGPHEFRVHVKTNDPLEPIKDLIILSNWVK